MRVCLIQPPCTLRSKGGILKFEPRLPLGLAYIAAVLLKDGHEVCVIDAQGEAPNTSICDGDLVTFGLPWESIGERVQKFSPEVVGISCLFSSRFANVLKTARLVKSIDRDIRVICGGIHPTIMPHEVLKNSEIDYVAIGEAEQTILDFVDGKPYKFIDGFGYVSNDCIHINRKSRFIQDLDSLPFPARHLFPVDEYFKRERLGLLEYFEKRFDIHNTHRNSVITSRGCPNDCTFCSIHCTWGYKWRPRSPENVVAELKEMRDKYNIKEVSFDDDNLAVNKKRILEICGLMVKERLDLRWDTPNGISVNTLDREVLTAIKKSGCYSLNLAIESGDQHILRDVMHKSVNLEKAKVVIKICKDVGIRTFAYFVLGMPGETLETMQHSLDFAKNVPLDEIGITIATPFPSTKLYDECLNEGYIKPFNYENYPADNDIWHRDAIISTPWLSAQELVAFKAKFYHDFNRSSWRKLRRHTQRRLLMKMRKVAEKSRIVGA